MTFCESSDVSSKKNESTSTTESKFSVFLNSYSETSFDSLDLYASYELENKEFKFHGTKLDSLSVSILDKSASPDSQTEGYFACYRFKIGDSLVGLITRAPSYYSSTAIKVFIYDESSRLIVKTIDGADIFGDAGDASQFSTRIIKSDRPLFLTYGWSSYDRSVENENDTIVEKSNYFLLTQLINGRLDTISKDSSTIASKFPHAISTLASY